ncbi:HtaR suppressor protein [Profundibacterium mesophilum KAUST100406-0324]|uniref:HtaR suppressor protein n=1 Tax=Profundibacterium mesophilum KAUST100406-0324 TaxID=1037889 RepID=A0A921TDR3_9RHOB|nr:HtaR suppressor protein [Profundibacterium mesophilum KAUST100406-0324]
MTALAQDVSKLTDRYVEADIKAHPDRIRAFDGALHDRLAALVGDVDVDLDAPLSLEDE